MKNIISKASLLFVATVFALVFLSGCRTTHIDPPLYSAPTDLAAWYAAEQEAVAQDGDVYWVHNTHSMEPLLWGGDYLVVSPEPFKDRVVGEVITYDADWQPPEEPYVTHRAVAQDRWGFVMRGDNNQYSESRWRVTEKNYVGLVTAIWRIKE